MPNTVPNKDRMKLPRQHMPEREPEVRATSAGPWGEPEAVDVVVVGSGQAGLAIGAAWWRAGDRVLGLDVSAWQGNISQTTCWTRGSSPEVGSSSRSTGARCISASRIPSFWRFPFE